MLSPLSPTQQHAHAKDYWGNLLGAAKSLAIAARIEQSKRFHLIVTTDMQSAYQLQQELNFFLPDDADVSIFPDWEVLPYDSFSPHEDIISERLTSLYRLTENKTQALIITIPCLLHRLAPREYIEKNSFNFSVGEQLDREQFREKLIRNNYRLVSQVMTHGEFSIRGSILDIFPMGSRQALRIDFFDQEIESIKTFDPETQLSQDSQTTVSCLPAREFPLSDESISLFRRQWRENFAGNPIHSPIYESISDAVIPAGIEYYQPLFFAETACLSDYLPSDAALITLGDVQQAAGDFFHELEKRHEQLAHDITAPILKPEKVCFRVEELFAKLKALPQIIINDHSKHTMSFVCNALPDITVNYKSSDPLGALKKYISQHSKVLIVSESSGRREVIHDLLQEHCLHPKMISSWKEYLQSTDGLYLTQGVLHQGFYSDDIVVVTENELFSGQVKQQRRRQSKQLDPNVMVRDLTELKVGQAVVHLQHGVGRYLGLQKLKTQDTVSEYITLEYAEKDKIYVPVTSLHLISRYSGHDPEHAPLHKLGSDKWQRAKKKAVEKVHDIAVELLDVYAKREASSGYAFALQNADYQQFVSNFPFELTDDQRTAVAHVFADMSGAQCMDRLICGDVGFGKTEVALRASFLASSNGKQVAILVPTTLLAEQHYHTFCDRFADFPVKVHLLSRFRTPAQQQQTITGLANGQVDIVIGTHKLIQQTIKYHDLGLLIIDEEHRFGVKQKEKIKAFRHRVDILTMTATPIPRTLNLSLAGMRDISIISTPPARRLSVKTFVNKKNPSIIREAILREIMRGGQVFFVHNRVETIQAITAELSELVPEAKVQLAHGQMRERELENTMSRFYHRQFNVLVCTTIIENGIDIPTANTIIIDKADHFGLAQLHQLRGRVGRSHHQAYAYLIVPEQKAMTADAKRRLQAFAELEDLGAGFSLAIHDLEIRGAGEILGEDQSGHIDNIGFSLFMEMLERAVKSLQEGKKVSALPEEKTEPEINLNVSALIPEDYIHDINLRLTQYKRISNATDESSLRDLQIELIDRFGLLPVEVKRLFRITRLKYLATKLGVDKIEASKKSIRIEFNNSPNINPSTIIKLIQDKSNTYQLAGPNRLRLLCETADHDQRISAVADALLELETSSKT